MKFKCLQAIILLISFVCFFEAVRHKDVYAGIIDNKELTDSLLIKSGPEFADSLSITARIDSLMSFAKLHIGTPYRAGGKNERGFDCSGFTSFVYKNFGICLPPNSGSQATVGTPVSKNEIRTGDLIFFKGHNSRASRIGHVGIVTDVRDNEVLFIHASSQKGIMITSANAPYYLKRYVTARRVIHR